MFLTRKKSTASNVLSLGTGQVVARIVAFIGTAYLSRVLGPSGFGIIGFATALVGYVGLAVTVGFNEIGAREVARRPGDASTIAASVIALRVVLAAGAYGGLALLVLMWQPVPELRSVILLTGLLFLPLSLDTSWMFKGLELTRRVGVSLVLGQLIFVGLLLAFVRGPGDVAKVPVAQVSGELAAVLLLIFAALRFQPVRFNWRDGRSILRQSGFLAASRILRTLIFSFDVLLLGILMDVRFVGLYTADYRLCFLLLVISDAVRESYLPGFARAVTDGPKSMARVAARSTEMTVAVGAPMVVGGIVLAEPILRLLFGADYGEGAAALRILLLSIGVIFINTTVHNVILAYHRLRLELSFIAVAAVANVLLNFVLIPRFGLVGAATATASAEVIILGAGIVAIYREGVTIGFRYALRPLLASGVMAIVVAALGSRLPVVLTILIGAASYVIALAVLGGIPGDVKSEFEQKLWPAICSKWEAFVRPSKD